MADGRQKSVHADTHASMHTDTSATCIRMHRCICSYTHTNTAICIIVRETAAYPDSERVTETDTGFVADTTTHTET